VERLVAWIVRGLAASWRVRAEGALPAGAAVIGCWHGDALVLGGTHRDSGMVVMVSLSDDGARGVALLRHLGYDVVRGSSSRGAVQAARTALRALACGRKVVVAMDGPRGPPCAAKPGAEWLARSAGVPFLRCEATATGLRLATWDRMIVAWPWTTVRVRYALIPPGDAAARA
jgi:lysophospholipid acyltransferase (LPLAT)-like uncharacterized protein